MSEKLITVKEFLETEEIEKRNYTFCRKCNKKRPLRTHHCSICDKCIIRMDHHCPWINNCIGIKNYKMFYLLILYTTILFCFVFITLSYSIISGYNKKILIIDGFYIYNLFFLCLISFVFSIVFLVFLKYHTQFVIIKNRTTLENIAFNDEKKRYDEINKIRKSENQEELVLSSENEYNKGIISNIKEMLGDNFFLWLIPIPTRKKHISCDFFDS